MSLQRVPQAGTLPNPTVSFAYGLSPIETRLGPQQAKISVSQMFPWFGTLNAKEKQAALTAQSYYEQYIYEKNKLTYNISSIYYNLYFINKSIEYTHKQLEIIGTLERLANIKLENNQASMVDVLRFQMAQEELQSKLLLKEDNKRTVSIKFNLLLNKTENSNINFPDSLLVPEKQHFFRDSIKNNPQLKAIEANYTSSDYQIKASKLSGYPSIGLGLDYAFIGNRTDMQVQGSGTNAIMPMISISIPLYRKKYKAKINESQLNKQRIEYQQVAVQNSLISEYEKAMQDYNDAYRNIVLSKSLLEKANKVLNILKVAYTTSGKDYDQLLEMQNITLKYQINYEKAVIDLYKAISYLEFLVAR